MYRVRDRIKFHLLSSKLHHDLEDQSNRPFWAFEMFYSSTSITLSRTKISSSTLHINNGNWSFSKFISNLIFNSKSILELIFLLLQNWAISRIQVAFIISFFLFFLLFIGNNLKVKKWCKISAKNCCISIYPETHWRLTSCPSNTFLWQKDPTQHHVVLQVVTFLWSPSTWVSDSVFSWLSWPWYFLR